MNYKDINMNSIHYYMDKRYRIQSVTSHFPLLYDNDIIVYSENLVGSSILLYECINGEGRVLSDLIEHYNDILKITFHPDRRRYYEHVIKAIYKYKGVLRNDKIEILLNG